MAVNSPWPAGVPPIESLNPELRADPRAGDGWAVWAHDQPPRQRAVLYYCGVSPAGASGTYRSHADERAASLGEVLRDRLRVHLFQAVDSVMAFGAILELTSRAFSVEELLALVHSYREDTGSLQFIVQAVLPSKSVIATRTLVGGSLRRTHDGLLLHYKRMGFEVTEVPKGRGR